MDNTTPYAEQLNKQLHDYGTILSALEKSEPEAYAPAYGHTQLYTSERFQCRVFLLEKVLAYETKTHPYYLSFTCREENGVYSLYCHDLGSFMQRYGNAWDVSQIPKAAQKAIAVTNQLAGSFPKTPLPGQDPALGGACLILHRLPLCKDKNDMQPLFTALSSFRQLRTSREILQRTAFLLGYPTFHALQEPFSLLLEAIIEETARQASDAARLGEYADSLLKNNRQYTKRPG